jgi:hypothetical protein
MVAKAQESYREYALDGDRVQAVDHPVEQRDEPADGHGVHEHAAGASSVTLGQRAPSGF